MKLMIVTEKEAGQRFDKYLSKYLKEAPVSFLYKMLRKKNITLNGTKASGKEKLTTGDEVSFFLADETIQKFQNPGSVRDDINNYQKAYSQLGYLPIVYEDEHLLVIDKPPGLLTQKAKEADLTLNEWLIGYLLDQNTITDEALTLFKPSVCNRLDRNTSGMVLCGKTLKGSQMIGTLLKERSLHKYYRLLVAGCVSKGALLEGYLAKNTKENKVSIHLTPLGNDDSYIQTRYKPVSIKKRVTLLEAELITGKTHQIRAHMASIGHPLLGDPKYGDDKCNAFYRKKYGVKSQLLHAYRLEFPLVFEPFPKWGGLVLIADMPKRYEKIMEEE